SLFRSAYGRFTEIAGVFVDRFQAARADQGLVFDEGEMRDPEAFDDAKAPAHGLLPGTETGAAIAEVLHVIGVPRVHAGKYRDLPCHFALRLELDDLRGSEHFVQVVPLDRLKRPHQLPAGHEIAVLDPEKAAIPLRPQVGMRECSP